MCSNKTTESFTPYLKQIYKPYIRSCKNYTNNSLEKFKTKSYNFLKKKKLI